MASSNEVLLGRHGETDDNAVGRLQGQRDTPLNDRGRGHARAIAIGLADENVRAMCCRALARTRETAAVPPAAADIA